MALKKNVSGLDLVEKTVTELMGKYHNCAQCTLVGIQIVSGLKDEGLAKASTGFAGGIGGMQSVCGALTGATLALGMKYGRDISFLEGPPRQPQKNNLKPWNKLPDWPNGSNMNSEA